MDLGRLAPASEVTGSEDIPYHFKKAMVSQFKNVIVCPPATSETGVDGQCKGHFKFVEACVKLEKR
jgi:hypothetical protein